MKQLDIVHPAARTLVDIARSQDSEVGDGTTSVVLLACSFMKVKKREEDINKKTNLSQASILSQFKSLACARVCQQEAKPYIEDGVHPQTIIKAYRAATALAIAKIKELSVSVPKSDKGTM